MVVDRPVAIIGGFGLGNFGDDLLMLAAINAVRQVHQASEIAVLVYRGGEAYCRKLDPATTYLARDLQTQIRAQVAIYGGGTQFYHFGERPARRNSYERAFRFWQGLKQGRMSLRNLWRPQTARISIGEHAVRAAISIGLGPFADEASQRAAAERLRGCEFLSVRDQTSLGYCREWGLTQAQMHSDFGYASSLWGAELPQRLGSSTPAQVGIVVRDWYQTQQGRRHLSASIALAEALTRRGHQPKFFVFDAVADTTCLRMLKRRPEPVHVWQPDRISIRQQLEWLSTCDLLVTARAHGAIVGAVLGIPSVCTVIEPKLEIMAESLGQAATVWQAPFSIDTGIEAVETMLQNLEAAANEAQCISEQHRRSAIQSAQELADFLKRRRTDALST